MSYNIGAWQVVGDQKFRHRRVYEPEWMVDFENSIGCAAPGAGGVAFVRDTRKFIMATSAHQNAVDVYDAGGQRRATLRLGSAIVGGMGWTDDEQLIVVMKSGRAYAYTIDGNLLGRWRIDIDSDDSVEHVSVSGDAVAVCTKKARLFVFHASNDRVKEWTLVNSTTGEPKVLCLAVFSPRDGVTEVLAGTECGHMILATDGDCHPMELSDYPLVRLAVSRDGGRFAAWGVAAGPLTDVADDGFRVSSGLEDGEEDTSISGSDFEGLMGVDLSSDGSSGDSGLDDLLGEGSPQLAMGGSEWIQAGNGRARGVLYQRGTDFSPLGDGDSQSIDATPPQLGWAGDRVVAVHSGNRLILCTEHGEVHSQPVADSLVLCSEVDGIHLYSSMETVFIGRVPTETIQIFSLGSSAPAALVVDAYTEHINGSARAYDLLPRQRSVLAAAVGDVVTAAAAELDREWQQTLLGAAAFARVMLGRVDAPEETVVDDDGDFGVSLFDASVKLSNTFETTQHIIRACNELRDLTVAMPLTHSQFQGLGVSTVLTRLARRSAHAQGVAIARWFALSPAPVLLDWARRRILDTSVPQETVSDEIEERLRGVPGVSYRELVKLVVSNPDLKMRRGDVLTRLIEGEDDPRARADLLLLCDKPSNALDAAVSESDSALVMHVLLSLNEHGGSAELYKVAELAIRSPLALAVTAAFARFCRPDLLPAITAQLPTVAEGDPAPATLLTALLSEAGKAPSIVEHESALVSMAQFAPPAFADAIGKQSILLEAQERLSEEYGKNMMGLTVMATLRELYKMGADKRAASLAKSLHVSDKRVMKAKINGFVDAGEWSKLGKLCGNGKRLCVSPHAFFLACKRAQNIGEAARYAQLNSDPIERARDLFAIERFREGAAAAALARNVDSIYELMRDCRGQERAQSALQAVIDKMSA